MSKSRLSFQQILDFVEQLDLEQRESLIDIVKRRLVDLRRDELAMSLKESRVDYAKKHVKSGSVADLMKDLER